MGLNAFGIIRLPEPDHADGRIGDFRGPVLGTDREPDLAWELVGETMEGKCRQEADYSLRGAFCDFTEVHMKVCLRVRSLIEAAPNSQNVSCFHSPGNRGCADPHLAQLERTSELVLGQIGEQAVFLCGGC